MKYSKLLFISIFSILVLTPFTLAFFDSGFGGFGYYNSPLYFFDNEWVMFGIYFIIFFAVIFYTVNRSFKDPKIAGVIALGLSLLISVTLAQRGWLYSYMGTELGGWILVIAVLIAFGFLLRFAYESFGRIGAIAAILIFWVVLHGSDPYTILPAELVNNNVILLIYEFIAGYVGLIFLIIISAIIISARMTRRGLNAGRMSDHLFGR
ncbi:hypothetical protein GOV12_05925 [Candidatus Pacearchaeota archaeon]|nr:hypothetical protein [Candidatus Pacearchaeota archaeon]